MTTDFRTAFISQVKHTLKEEDLWGVMNVETGDTLSTFETEQDAKDFVSEIQQQLIQDDLSPGEWKVFKYDDNAAINTNIKFVNLTPHAVKINDRVFESEGLARCLMTRKVLEEIDGIEIRFVDFGEVTGLPDPVPNTFYIVSQIVASALKGKRDDLLIPDGAIRDEKGQIIGCTGLARV